jgi:nucleoside 2-deoxyribosyltransferase
VKVYITSRFKGGDNQQEIEALCVAVKKSGLVDFNFTRDVENYKKTFDNPKELWAKAYDELSACDMLLVDVSDGPTGGRLVEAGMAYALRKPVIVTVKKGIHYKELFKGIGDTVIEYDSYDDLSAKLKRFDTERSFNLTDKWSVFGLFLFGGAALGWVLAQVFMPLGVIAAITYWFMVRHFVPLLRAFDRVVIYIPLATIWGSGFYLLQAFSVPIALAWLAAFWLITAVVLRKLQFSL